MGLTHCTGALQADDEDLHLLRSFSSMTVDIGLEEDFWEAFLQGSFGRHLELLIGHRPAYNLCGGSRRDGSRDV